MENMKTLLAVCLASWIVAGSISAQEIDQITGSIQTHIASQNWDGADQGYEALYQAYKAEYGAGSGRALAMAKVLGEWKIQAFRNDLLSGSEENILGDTSSFYSELISEIEQQQDQLAADLIDPLYGQVMVNYHQFLLTSRKPLSAYQGVGEELIQEEQCVDSEDRGGVVDCQYMEVPNRDYIESQAQAREENIAQYWDAIALSLQRIIDICAEHRYLLDQAEAQAHLGDYHMYGGEQDLALTNYFEAYQLLLRNTDPDATEWLDRLFMQSTVVPSLTTVLPGASPAPILTQGLRFGFDVGADGKASNIEVLDGARSADRQVRQSVMRIISGATFRPFFDTEGVLDSHSIEI